MTKLSELTVAEFHQIISSLVPVQESIDRSKLLSVSEVAKLLGYKTSNIYALTHKRLIPHMKKGTRLWFSKLEILQWVESGKKKTFEEIKNTIAIKNGKIKNS